MVWIRPTGFGRRIILPGCRHHQAASRLCQTIAERQLETALSERVMPWFEGRRRQMPRTAGAISWMFMMIRRSWGPAQVSGIDAVVDQVRTLQCQQKAGVTFFRLQSTPPHSPKPITTFRKVLPGTVSVLPHATHCIRAYSTVLFGPGGYAEVAPGESSRSSSPRNRRPGMRPRRSPSPWRRARASASWRRWWPCWTGCYGFRGRPAAA